MPPLTPKIALGVAAHPDDLDFGASGILSQWIEQGCKVYYLILTDGSKGTADVSVDSAQLVKIRQAEQRSAAARLGSKEVFFLNYPDGALEVTMDLKRDIVRVIRQLKPEVVITMDPSMLYAADLGFVNHPDHRAAGQATMDAVFPLARDHLSFSELYRNEQLAPHKTAHLLLINLVSPNFVVDIADKFDKKIDIISAHASQVPPTDQLREFVSQIAGCCRESHGLRYAETFVRLDIAG